MYLAGSCFIKRMLQLERGEKNRTKHPVGAIVLLGQSWGGNGTGREPRQEQERKTHLSITEPKLPGKPSPAQPQRLQQEGTELQPLGRDHGGLKIGIKTPNAQLGLGKLRTPQPGPGWSCWSPQP